MQHRYRTGQTVFFSSRAANASRTTSPAVTSSSSSRWLVLSTQLSSVTADSSVRAPVAGWYQVSSGSAPAVRARRRRRVLTVSLTG